MTAIRRAALLYLFALLLAWAAYVTYIGGDSLLRFRFFAPVMPLFYAVTVVSIAALVDAVHIERAPRPWAPRAAIAFACAGAILFTFIWVRGTLPRFRYDQLMGFTWKFLFPVAVLNLLVTSFLVSVVS